MPYTPPDGTNIVFNLDEEWSSQSGDSLLINLTDEDVLVFAGQSSSEAGGDYTVIYEVDFSGETSQETFLDATFPFFSASMEVSTEGGAEVETFFETRFIGEASAEGGLDVSFLLNFTGESPTEARTDFTVFFEVEIVDAETSQELPPVTIFVADVLASFSGESSTEGETSYSPGVAATHGATYGLVVSAAHEASYTILHEGQAVHEAVYGLVEWQGHEAEYEIRDVNVVVTGHTAAYQILEDKSKTHVAEYALLTADGVGAFHQATYLIGLEGFVGLSERGAFVPHPWDSLTDDRLGHVHLYNTYVADRSATYERYFEAAAFRFGIVERELFYEERTGTYSRWWEEGAERKAVTGLAINVVGDDRGAIYARYFKLVTARQGFVSFSTYSDREGIFECVWNSLRYGTLNFWRYSERRAVTYGRSHPGTAAQRFGYVQLDRTKFDSTRMGFADSFCVSFTCEVQVNWQELCTVTVQSTWRELFTGTVTDSSFELCPIPVPEGAVKERSLYLVYTKETCEEARSVDLGRRAVIFLPTTDFSGSYHFEGWLFPTRRLLFLEAQPFFADYEPFSSPEEYFKFLQRHGHFTVRINGEEMEWFGRKQIITSGLFFPVKIDVYIERSLIDLVKRPGFRLCWAYPEVSLDVHKTVFVFEKT